MKTVRRAVAMVLLVGLFPSCDLIRAFLDTGSGTNTPPSVEIAETDTTIFTDQQFTLHAGAEDPDGDGLTFVWTIDGAAQSDAGAETFSFIPPSAGPGVYTVTVTVSDGAEQAMDSITVTVQERPPVNQPPAVALLSPPVNLDWGTEHVYRADASDEDVPNLSFQWSVNAQVQVGETAAQFAFSRQPTEPTEYTITVTVSDGEYEDSYSATVTVTGPPNQSPTVDIQEESQTLANGQQLVIHADGEDPEGETLTYTWYVNSALQPGVDSGEFSFGYAPPSTAQYLVLVVVSDGELSAQAELLVTVLGPDNEAPHVDLERALGTLGNGEPLTITAVAIDPDGDQLYYQWFVGGVEQEGQTGRELTFTRTPDALTNYVIEVEVTDGILSATESTVVTVAGSGSATEEGGLFALYEGWEAQMVGAPPGSVEIEGYDNSIYALTDVGELWYLDGVWRAHGTAMPSDAISMAVHNGFLHLLTREGGLLVFDGGWAQTGFALLPEAVAIATQDGRLTALVETGELRYWDGGWQTDPIRLPEGATTLANGPEGLLVLTGDGRVFKRETSWFSELLSVPANSISITSQAGVYYCLAIAGP